MFNYLKVYIIFVLVIKRLHLYILGRLYLNV